MNTLIQFFLYVILTDSAEIFGPFYSRIPNIIWLKKIQDVQSSIPILQGRSNVSQLLWDAADESDSIDFIRIKIYERNREMRKFRKELEDCLMNSSIDTQVIEQLKINITANTQNLIPITSDTVTNDQNIQALKINVMLNAQGISDVQADISTNEQELQDLEADVMTNEGDITSLRTNIMTNEQDISDLETEQDTQDTRMDGLEARIEDLEALEFVCPASTEEIGDYCYTLHIDPKNQADAAAECSGQNGYLVEPPPSLEGVEALIAGLKAKFPVKFATIFDALTPPPKTIWTSGAQFPENDADLKFSHNGLVVLKEDPVLLGYMSHRESLAMVFKGGIHLYKLSAAARNQIYYYACQYKKIPPAH